LSAAAVLEYSFGDGGDKLLTNSSSTNYGAA